MIYVTVWYLLHTCVFNQLGPLSQEPPDLPALDKLIDLQKAHIESKVTLNYEDYRQPDPEPTEGPVKKKEKVCSVVCKSL